MFLRSRGIGFRGEGNGRVGGLGGEGEEVGGRRR